MWYWEKQYRVMGWRALGLSMGYNDYFYKGAREYLLNKLICEGKPWGEGREGVIYIPREKKILLDRENGKCLKLLSQVYV